MMQLLEYKIEYISQASSVTIINTRVCYMNSHRVDLF
jgi:hypothetical protein